MIEDPRLIDLKRQHANISSARESMRLDAAISRFLEVCLAGKCVLVGMEVRSAIPFLLALGVLGVYESFIKRSRLGINEADSVLNKIEKVSARLENQRN